MSVECYEIANEQLILIDPELDLHVSSPMPLESEYDSMGRIVHGEERTLFPDGSLQRVAFYRGGQLHGPSSSYSAKGQLLAQTWFVHGLREGKARFYYASGSLFSVQRFRKGLAEGLQEYFYEDGSVKSVLPYRQGQLHGCVRLFLEDEELQREVTYSHGKKEGYEQIFNQDHEKIYEGEYQAGSPVSVHRHYFKSGILREEKVYHRNGSFDKREWDLQGNLLFEGVFHSDLTTYREKKRGENGEFAMRQGKWKDGAIDWQ